jgi:hypothetical protein
VAAAVVAWVANRTVRLPATIGPAEEAEAALLALYHDQTAATVGGFAKVVAAAGLVVAAGAFCHRPRSGALPNGRRWAPATALACLAAWASTVVVASAVRGTLARQAARGADNEPIRLGLDFTEYVGALGLVLLAAGAIHLAVTAGWWALDEQPQAARTARGVQVAAIAAAVAAGAVAVVAAPRMPVPERSFDDNVFEPGSWVHGGVTVIWLLLLVALAVDGWWRRQVDTGPAPASAPDCGVSSPS